MALGLQPSQKAIEDGYIDDTKDEHKNVVNAPQVKVGLGIEEKKGVSNIGRDESMKFPSACPNCFKDGETTMCITDIPHFKEVIIMCFLCEYCGYKSNEIKGGGAIPRLGTVITLKVENKDDLAREVLKSDTAGVSIPTLELELEEGGLDGLYTTVEGLLLKIYQRLKDSNPFGIGDSSIKNHLEEEADRNVKFKSFLQKLECMTNGQRFPFELIIKDPLSNSFVGPILKDALELSLMAENNHDCYQNYVDPRMKINEYERSYSDNEILGLNDMKTENYSLAEENYGTEQMEELPDRLRRIDVRGPDHPVKVAKAPVLNDTTVMGTESDNYAVPSIYIRETNK